MTLKNLIILASVLISIVACNSPTSGNLQEPVQISGKLTKAQIDSIKVSISSLDTVTMTVNGTTSRYLCKGTECIPLPVPNSSSSDLSSSSVVSSSSVDTTIICLALQCGSSSSSKPISSSLVSSSSSSFYIKNTLGNPINFTIKDSAEVIMRRYDDYKAFYRDIPYVKIHFDTLAKTEQDTLVDVNSNYVAARVCNWKYVTTVSYYTFSGNTSKQIFSYYEDANKQMYYIYESTSSNYRMIEYDKNLKTIEDGYYIIF